MESKPLSPLRGTSPGGGSEICDGCHFLQIERPVNRYDVWHACCTDPEKPLPGARRVVDTAPAGSERGPAGIRRPRWCRRSASRGTSSTASGPPSP